MGKERFREVVKNRAMHGTTARANGTPNHQFYPKMGMGMSIGTEAAYRRPKPPTNLTTSSWREDDVI
jgi:hypothetical protein